MAYTRPRGLKAVYIRLKERFWEWEDQRADHKRDAAARAIMAWIARRPDELRLNAAIQLCFGCSGDYPVSRRLAEWVLDRPECSAEMVLFYLGGMGFHRLAEDGWTEESLRADPEWFAIVDGLVSGLRSGRYRWRGNFRSDGRDQSPILVEEWRDVPSLRYCDLYAQLETERPPNSILDAYELLGSYSGERVGREARKVLARRRS